MQSALPFDFCVDTHQLNRVGTESVRTFLGKDGKYTVYGPQFNAADKMLLLHGLHNDGTHNVPKDTFHPLFDIARQYYVGEDGHKDRVAFREEMERLVFDAVRQLYHIVCTTY